MVGMRDREPVVEHVQLAGDQQLRSGGCLGFAGEAKEHQFGHAGLVSDDDPPGLAGCRRPFVPHHLDGKRRHGARLRGADRRPGATVQVSLGHMKQQVDGPIAACCTRDQLRDGWSYAAQTGQGSEKWSKRIGVHRLTATTGVLIW
jgi:hypothetical protein